MQVQLTPDQEGFVQQALDSGRFQRPEDAVAEALRLWEQRERSRGEILAAVDAAEASLVQNAGMELTAESVSRLAERVKQRGRERLAHQKSTDL